MKFDMFFAICQTPVDGHTPSERVMFENFFDQAVLADELGIGTAWVAETHLSCQVQKGNPGAVIPKFQGEIGLNTDILQLAHVLFAKTRQMNIGSAIRNILCNGGPLAHAEAIKTFLTYHGLDKNETRHINIGFATGRFPFSNFPYGINPRNELERVAWPVIKGKLFLEATEIFLRTLKGENLASADVAPLTMSRADFRSDEHWAQTIAAYGKTVDDIPLDKFWVFDRVGVIPFEAPMHLLKLTIGSQDAKSQDLANTFLPVDVFNLSITPTPVIEETHARMLRNYHPDGGAWTRANMPRTVLVFINDDPKLTDAEKTQAARAAAQRAMENYWNALEGTLDQKKIDAAVDNALIGHPDEVAAQMEARFHPDDRLMLWFDFNNHDNDSVKSSMRAFMQKVAPRFSA